MANQKAAQPASNNNPVTSLVAELQTRAKAAQETLAGRQAELVKFSNDNLEALKASGKIVVAGVKPLAGEAVANTRRQLEAARATVKSLQEAKSARELVKLQAEAAKANYAAMIADSKAFSASLVKLVGEAAVPLKDRVAAVRQLAA